MFSKEIRFKGIDITPQYEHGTLGMLVLQFLITLSLIDFLQRLLKATVPQLGEVRKHRF